MSITKARRMFILLSLKAEPEKVITDRDEAERWAEAGRIVIEFARVGRLKV